MLLEHIRGFFFALFDNSWNNIQDVGDKEMIYLKVMPT